MRVDLTVLVPVFNEEVNLRAHLPVLERVAERCSRRYEILVVDDGSTDQSAREVVARSSSNRRIRLVHHPRNLGPGAAIPTALFWARGDWILLVPADLACEPDEIPDLWPARIGCDVVVGLRSDRSDNPAWRQVLSFFYIHLLRMLTSSSMAQFNYLQLYRREIFAGLQVRSRGVFVTAEIILSAEQAGLRLVQVPLTYRPRKAGKAAGATLSSITRTATEMAAYLGRRGKEAS